MENLREYHQKYIDDAEGALLNIEALNQTARRSDWELLKKGLRQVRKLGVKARINLSDDCSSTLSDLDRFLETVEEGDKVMYSSHQFTSTPDIIKHPPIWNIESLEVLYEHFNFSTDHDDYEWVREAVRVLQDHGLIASWSGLICDCVRVQLGFSGNQIEAMKQQHIKTLEWHRKKYWECAA